MKVKGSGRATLRSGAIIRSIATSQGFFQFFLLLPYFKKKKKLP
jgi:hypothetical protein